jgi:hypothetical protein
MPDVPMHPQNRAGRRAKRTRTKDRQRPEPRVQRKRAPVSSQSSAIVPATAAMTRAKPSRTKPNPLAWPGGTIVGGMDSCTCGHAPEEHGRDPRFPSSTSCTADGCGCIAYEANPE